MKMEFSRTSDAIEHGGPPETTASERVDLSRAIRVALFSICMKISRRKAPPCKANLLHERLSEVGFS